MLRIKQTVTWNFWKLLTSCFLDSDFPIFC